MKPFKKATAAALAVALALSLCAPAGAIVSSHDKNKLTPSQQHRVDIATQKYEDAVKSGNTEAAWAAHAEAEKVRAEANYSGGQQGNEYHPWGGGSSSYDDDDEDSYTPPPPTYYTITASAGAHGSISPTGASSVREGNSKTYTITPVYGYSVADVKVDGASVGAKTTYTFSNLSGSHAIAATFKTAGKVSLGNVSITDQDGNAFSQFKAGYGFEVKADLNMQYTTITSAAAKMSNGDACGMELVGGQLQFVKNAGSATNARKYYVPVTTKDGTFSVTITIKSKDAEGVALPDVVKSFSFQIKGSMYDDDFTGSGR